MKKFFISIICVVVLCVTYIGFYEIQMSNHDCKNEVHDAFNCPLTQEEAEKIVEIKAEKKYGYLLSDYECVDSWHNPEKNEWIVLWSIESNSIGGGVAFFVDCESKHVISMEPQA